MSGQENPSGRPAPTFRRELDALAARLVDSKLLYVAIAASLLLAIIFQSPFFGIITALLLVLGLAAEVAVGLSREGVKSELKETVIALAVAVGFFLALPFILQTSSPLNSVVSCSMLPNLQVGDLIILQGGELSAPTAKISQADVLAIDNSLLATAYAPGVPETKVPRGVAAYCANPAHKEDVCYLYNTNPEGIIEKRGPLLFKFEACKRVSNNGSSYFVQCSRSVIVNGIEYGENFSNSVIVYAPQKGDLFGLQGDTIHRVFLRLETENGNSYYLAKGDNNVGFDLQAYSPNYGRGNSIVSAGQVKGRMLVRAPVLGYFKMFLFGRFSGAGSEGEREFCESRFA